MLLTTLLDREHRASRADKFSGRKGRAKSSDRSEVIRRLIERIREMESDGQWQPSMAALAQKLGITSGSLQAMVRDKENTELRSYVSSIVWNAKTQRREAKQRTGWRDSQEVQEVKEERAIA